MFSNEIVFVWTWPQPSSVCGVKHQRDCFKHCR